MRFVIVETMQQWEYLNIVIQECHIGEATDSMNGDGKVGWELVSATRVVIPDAKDRIGETYWRMFYKRPSKPKASPGIA